jgi:hypothetical protein
MRRRRGEYEEPRVDEKLRGLRAAWGRKLGWARDQFFGTTFSRAWKLSLGSFWRSCTPEKFWKFFGHVGGGHWGGRVFRLIRFLCKVLALDWCSTWTAWRFF